jgi:hypothetical protein
MLSLHFDCFCGASGDMIVGALLDLGLDLEELRKPLLSLGVQGFDLRAEGVVKKGVRATQFHVDVDPDVKQPHRHLHHVLEIINAGDLPDAVKEAAGGTFRRIAEAEAEVHQTTIEKVHFHEVGAVDSIVDVVGAHLALHLHGAQRVTASSMATGSGTVKCAHGVMPVPAPATALLLKGLPSYSGEVEAELTTPTGAALMASAVDSFGGMPVMTTSAVGHGSGQRDLPDRPNVLRVFKGQTAGSTESTESIHVVEANVDDMTGELIAVLTQALLEAGARDAFAAPVYGKKGRPAHLITALCDEKDLGSVARAFLCHSSTFGMRMRREERICLERSWSKVETPWGSVRVKLGWLHGARGKECTLRRAPEFEDCRKLAETAGQTVAAVYEAALAAAIRGEYVDEQ